MKIKSTYLIILSGILAGIGALTFADEEYIPFAKVTQVSQPSNPDRFIVADLGDDRFSVTYIDKEKTSSEHARDQAFNYAAHVAEERGYNYFTVESEENVRIVQSDKSNPSPPVNLYQELIIEKNYGRDPVNQQRPPATQVYPGTKLIVKGYIDHAPWGAYDVHK